jgi:queuine tRNA-ribosyltransferase
MSAFGFQLLAGDGASAARRGRLTTAHGTVETPVFMPVGTQGTVKGMDPAALEAMGVEIVLGNTYHLYLRPGMEAVTALGGLHKMMAWDRPILTDSGGFQVFSLRDSSRLTEEGVTFQSHLDGTKHLLTPELAMEVQETLGSDIMMALDHCPPADVGAAEHVAALERTTRWARRCVDARSREDNGLFGIIQGGMDASLRARSAAELMALPFDGFAIGGLSVGETRAEMHAMVQACAPLLPEDKPRYLMGVGTPEDLLVSVAAGVDMFDCVLPTRNARNGRLLTSAGDLNIRNAVHRLDDQPIDAACGCTTCARFSRGYLRHLDRAGEILASVLCTTHNLHYLVDLMAQARARIGSGDYGDWYPEVLARRRSSEGR